MDLVPISIGVLNSRNIVIKDCISSIMRQVYPEVLTDFIVIDNLDKHLSIGAGFNEIAKKAKHEWVLFVGDDDLLARTYLFNLAVYLQTCKEKHPDYDIVAVTTNLIITDNEKRIGLDVAPTGMWSRQFLLDNKFNEDLKRYVDTDLFARVKEMPDKVIMRDSTNYGYYYIQHGDNVSFNKFDAKTRILKDMEERNTRNLEYGG